MRNGSLLSHPEIAFSSDFSKPGIPSVFFSLTIFSSAITSDFFDQSVVCKFYFEVSLGLKDPNLLIQNYTRIQYDMLCSDSILDIEDIKLPETAPPIPPLPDLASLGIQV